MLAQGSRFPYGGQITIAPILQVRKPRPRARQVLRPCNWEAKETLFKTRQLAFLSPCRLTALGPRVLALCPESF